ncbi:hypothetical protein [Streptomyces hydrogenans]|uniref:hypothetical protein n=1 Tax=Streptomyces hydrogenans TaxID=1873719 RepID=UPI00167EBCD7|nr:hypothetical protein [Streptomyces hydrogenans]
MTDDHCKCGCQRRTPPPECPDCEGLVTETSSPSIEGTGYGHRGFVCDSRSCGWWDG